ncbi:hypothetical protein H112_00298 [Trichophyton rubrum D6]|uniref:Uncharacterized protein n=2 Tax=Trichophyton TaxID=5550 RepID=A0A022WHA4_TRIRU|nr:hypothetical protein H100_00299 [Trichophyton rubrum MR850]EZF46799.1 hypothetical protein H102_00298 [Trichophyton rubrum CBS 100081]EZF57458.1 hypothetical protein H103_00297 [Trichophyton rubrum CBS 288.86]EZF68064.1 hypothetical protein H104_00297 [Trichophyton rubrum CBS 289.86]EZF78726.1 hypothetical protein H105_00292 [Trichophyton soudanense CBS 452.61]EZF89415.1 hypothetical protein H110_00301 [Trichophyton rubrum MR1448]EZG00274.1 hypothetical protein H113_00301 [Trichophyton rub
MQCSSRDGVAAPLCNQMSRTLDGYKRLPLTRTSHPTTMDRGIREWTKLVQLDQPYQQEPPKAQARDFGKSKTKKQNEKPKKEKVSKKRTYPASSAGSTMTKEVQNILDSSCISCLYLLFPLAKGARKYLYLVAIYINPDRLLPKDCSVYGQCSKLARIKLSVMHLVGAQAPLGLSGAPIITDSAGLWDHYPWPSLQGSCIPSPKELRPDPGNLQPLPNMEYRSKILY